MMKIKIDLHEFYKNYLEKEEDVKITNDRFYNLSLLSQVVYKSYMISMNDLKELILSGFEFDNNKTLLSFLDPSINDKLSLLEQSSIQMFVDNVSKIDSFSPSDVSDCVIRITSLILEANKQMKEYHDKEYTRVFHSDPVYGV